ncbi:hypothetical protein Mal15_32920 [Stieleria maiorica]|uniref:Uncharacterized protein n=1 Tax=Stieleria maiorica TaxID=2795974 RepID=A0A5B9MGX7_9BACT|nr:hypothetical protein [Stieleria maiorica]QEF99230.1 hypothetical protein Mal15_32920 [Stieleria maiorica]
MSVADAPRALLLERLESRCMLAGETLLHAAHWQPRQNERFDSRDRLDQPAIISGAFSSISQKQSSRLDRGLVHQSSPLRSHAKLDGERPRVESPHLVTSQGDWFRNVSAHVGHQRQSFSVQRASSLPAFNVIRVQFFVSEETTARSERGFPTVSAAERQGTSISVQVGNLGTGVIGDTISEESVASSKSDAPETFSEAQVSNPGPATANGRNVPQTQADVLVRARGVVSDAISASDTPKSTSTRTTDAVAELTLPADPLRLKTVNVDQMFDVTIIHLHSFHGETQSSDASASDSSWELGIEALQRLRDIADDTSDGASRTELRVVDQAIVDWFGGATGLIDDIRCETELPAIAQNINASLVEVVLDATVGMHRSVGLIADSGVDGEESPASKLRGEILAVIAEEFAGAIASEGQPRVDSVDAPSPIRHSGIAYPGALIVAGLLAISTRRRTRQSVEPLSGQV